MAITLYSDKGSELTIGEMDTNFDELNKIPTGKIYPKTKGKPSFMSSLYWLILIVGRLNPISRYIKKNKGVAIKSMEIIFAEINKFTSRLRSE